MGRIMLATSNSTDEEYGGTYGSTVVLTIPANTYSTWETALAVLETAFNSLTDEQKRRCMIVRNDSVYHRCVAAIGRFSSTYSYLTENNIASFDLESHIYLLTTFRLTGEVISQNLSNNAQNTKLDLIIT